MTHSNNQLEEILDGSALNKHGKVKYVVPPDMLEAIQQLQDRAVLEGRIDELETYVKDDYRVKGTWLEKAIDHRVEQLKKSQQGGEK